MLIYDDQQFSYVTNNVGIDIILIVYIITCTNELVCKCISEYF